MVVFMTLNKCFLTDHDDEWMSVQLSVTLSFLIISITYMCTYVTVL